MRNSRRDSPPVFLPALAILLALAVFPTWVGASPGLQDAEDMPTAFALRQNRPNPFSGVTVIAFDIPESAAARVTIYDTHGRIIRTLTNNKYNPGRYEVTWQGLDQAGNSVGPGVYFVRLEAGEFTDIKKVMLLR